MHTTRLCVHFYTFLKQLVIHSKFSEEHANLLTVIDRTGTRSSARLWMLQSTSLKWKKKRTATHYWAWEREKALISVLTREGFDSSRQKSLGKQLPSVLAFLDQHEHHMEWSQLQSTLLSPSCWLWWDCGSVEVTESGHISHWVLCTSCPCRWNAHHSIDHTASRIPALKGSDWAGAPECPTAPWSGGIIPWRSLAEARLVVQHLHNH